MDLLKAASGKYEVLVTVDRNLPYQWNISGLEIAILVLAAKRNSYVRLNLMPRALTALEALRTGDIFGLKSETNESARVREWALKCVCGLQ